MTAWQMVRSGPELTLGDAFGHALHDLIVTRCIPHATMQSTVTGTVTIGIGTWSALRHLSSPTCAETVV